MTKEQLEKENARLRIAIEAARGCHSFEKARVFLPMPSPIRICAAG